MKKLILVGVLLGLMQFNAFSQSKEQVYAGIILHIMKYVEWPSYEASLQVGVVNNSQLTAALNKAAVGKRIHFKNVVIQKLADVSSINKVNVLFLPKRSTTQLAAILDEVRKMNVLAITEAKSGSVKGAGVNFIEVGGKLKFELYMSDMKSCGLKVSEQLKKFAIVKS